MIHAGTLPQAKPWPKWAYLIAMLVIALGSLSLAAQEGNAPYSTELQRGREALQQGRPEEALQAFKRAKSLNDAGASAAYLGMAVSYERLGDFKEAVDSCDAALKRTKGDRDREAEIRNVRGIALVTMAKDENDKRLKEAEADFRVAAASGDAVPVARFNLGATLMRLNRDEEGRAELQAYLQRDANGVKASEARRLIENPRRARVPYAPEFSVTTRQGEQLSLTALKGKAVLLDFWGSWCGPCVQATPALAKIAKKFTGSPVVIVGIASDRRDDWNQFIDKHKLDWPQYLDERREIAELFGVYAYPTYIVVDPEGVVQGRRAGYGNGTDSWIESQLKKALKTDTK